MKKQGETFKPGLGYNVVITLKQMDDTPVKATIPKRVQVMWVYLFLLTLNFLLITYHLKNLSTVEDIFKQNYTLKIIIIQWKASLLILDFCKF